MMSRETSVYSSRYFLQAWVTDASVISPWCRLSCRALKAAVRVSRSSGRM
jgi:hypothetical protein